MNLRFRMRSHANDKILRSRSIDACVSVGTTVRNHFSFDFSHFSCFSVLNECVHAHNSVWSKPHETNENKIKIQLKSYQTGFEWFGFSFFGAVKCLWIYHFALMRNSTWWWKRMKFKWDFGVFVGRLNSEKYVNLAIPLTVNCSRKRCRWHSVMKTKNHTKL